MFVSIDQTEICFGQDLATPVHVKFECSKIKRQSLCLAVEFYGIKLLLFKILKCEPGKMVEKINKKLRRKSILTYVQRIDVMQNRTEAFWFERSQIHMFREVQTRFFLLTSLSVIRSRLSNTT